MARLDWSQREHLILEAIRDLEDDNPDLQNGAIEDATGLSDKDVGLGLQALIDDGYVEGSDGRTLRVGRRLRRWRTPCAEGPAARQAVPAEDARDALLAAIDDAIAKSDDPEEQAAGETVKAGLRSFGTKMFNELALSCAKRYAPGLEGG